MEKPISLIQCLEGFLVLTDVGNLYFGFFRATEAGIPPDIMWRKLPQFPKKPFEYKLGKERVRA